MPIIILPTPGASEGVWGVELNAAVSALNAAVDEIDTTVNQGRLSEEELTATTVEVAGTAQGVVYPEGAGLGAVTITAIQDACDLAAAEGKRVWAAGSITTSTTLTVNSDADLAGLTINYTGTGTAVIFGSTVAAASRRIASLPRVINAGKVGIGWAGVVGTVGIELVNLNSCAQIIVPYIRGFETGLLCYGQGTGFVHNTVNLGQMLDNKVNQKLSADATGWVNQNTFMNGRMAHSSGEGSAVAGVRHIEMVAGLANPINNNVWIGTSIEGAAPEYHVMFAGDNNMIMMGRWEADPCKVRWQTDSTRNCVFWGYGAHLITETFGTNATTNMVLASQSKITMSSTRGWTYENSTSGNPVLTVTEAGSRAAGEDVTTAYSFRLSSQRCSMKRRTDAADRIRIDGQNGVIYMGTGAADPTMFIANDTTNGLRMSGGYFRPNVDATTDLGTSSAQFRHEYLSGFLSIGESAADPAAPGADHARLFTRDNGSGKTQLCVRFPTGAVQVIATEP